MECGAGVKPSDLVLEAMLLAGSRLSLVSPIATRTGRSREAQRKRVYGILSRTDLVPDIA